MQRITYPRIQLTIDELSEGKIGRAFNNRTLFVSRQLVKEENVMTKFVEFPMRGKLNPIIQDETTNYELIPGENMCVALNIVDILSIFDKTLLPKMKITDIDASVDLSPNSIGNTFINQDAALLIASFPDETLAYASARSFIKLVGIIEREIIDGTISADLNGEVYSVLKFELGRKNFAVDGDINIMLVGKIYGL